MQKRIIHNLLSRKWLILLCFMLLPTVLEAYWFDERSSFYEQVTVLSYKKKRTYESSTFYNGAKLQLLNGAIVELDEYSEYSTYVNGNTRWGQISMHGISASPGVINVSWNGSDKYEIKLYCEKTSETFSIKEEKSNVSHYVSSSEDRVLTWVLSRPNATFKIPNFVNIASIDIYPIYDNDGLEYKFDIKKEKWTLYKANTASDSVSIKSNIDYNGSFYPVTSISNNAFGNLKTIKKLHIPSSVNYIGKNAFSGCDNIECVYIDDISSWCKIDFENKESNPLWSGSKLYVGTNEVNEIEYDETFDNINKYAFIGCLSLKKLTLGSNIKSIGDYAFDGCLNLKTVYSYNPTPISYGKVPFSSTTYEGTLYVPRNVLGTYRNKYPWSTFAKIAAIEGPDCDFEVNGLYYNVVDLVNRTCEVTFDTPYYSSYNQEKIVIPESVQYQGRTFQVVGISHDAFNGSKLVKKLTVPKSIKAIGENAFWNCSGLSELNIDNQIQKVQADLSKLPLTTVKFTGAGTTIPNWLKNNHNIKNVVFDCSNVEAVTDSAFYNCTSLTTIELPHSVKQIGTASFEGCKSIAEFRMPQELDNIKPCAFKNCQSLSGLAFERNLKVIGSEAFLGCTSLTTLNITAGIDSIANSAFNKCTGITTLNIADADSSIIVGCDTRHSSTAGLFASLPLKDVYLGRDIVCSSENTPFNLNKNIESLVIGHHVNKFPDLSLASQTQLKKLILGNKLETVPSFDKCTKLDELQIGSHIKNIPDFNNVQSLKKIKVYAGKPQTLTNDFSNKTYINCELLVPTGSIERYKEADKWKNFYGIIEYSADSKADSLKFKQERFNVYPNESFAVNPIVYPLDASEVFTWASSDDNIATVDEFGLVTAHTDGEAIITATTTDGTNLTAICNVVVKKLVPVKSISFEQSNYKVTIGQKVNLIAKIVPTNASYTSLNYVSSDKTIATVSDKGEIHGVNIGKCTITATSADGTNVKATCEVEVLPVYITSLTINSDKTQIVEGETMQLTISYEPENATISEVLWETSDPTLASINEEGALTAHKEGVVSIKATAKDGSTVFDNKEIEVLPLLQSSITANANTSTNLIALKWSAASHVKNIKDYNVYVSEDDGPFILWMHNTTSTSASFSGKAGKNYRFVVTLRNKDDKTERYNEKRAAVINL